MEPLYSAIMLLAVIFLGYLSEEKRTYFLLLIVLLVPAGLLMGYLLDDLLIYGILFILGIIVERMYMSYKWQMTKRPKSADYKPTQDWLMKIIATLIVILSIDLVSDIQLVYSFLSFFAGTILSWLVKKFEK